MFLAALLNCCIALLHSDAREDVNRRLLVLTSTAAYCTLRADATRIQVTVPALLASPSKWCSTVTAAAGQW
jgi:hypothetical protein